MRKIDKGVPISSFTEFIKKHHPVTWEDTKDVRRAWHSYILEYEQHRLSGYTEEPLSLDDSHIDHFRKQSLFNTLIFNWDNYIVDKKNDTYGARYKDRIVTTIADNERLINPVAEEDASRFFKYGLNGRIEVADGLSELEKDRAIFTVQAFNLNEASLVERRRLIINTILGPYDDLSDDIILKALAAEGFTSVVEQLLKERKQEEDSK